MDIIIILVWIVLITLAVGIARQLSEQKVLDFHTVGYPYYKLNKGLLEQFENPANPANPAPVSDKYILLPLEESTGGGNLTAKTCYDKDFMAQSAKTGNYIQRTNNYRHGAPDNCSAPLTEFVGSFYKNP